MLRPSWEIEHQKWPNSLIARNPYITNHKWIFFGTGETALAMFGYFRSLGVSGKHWSIEVLDLLFVCFFKGWRNIGISTGMVIMTPLWRQQRSWSTNLSPNGFTSDSVQIDIWLIQIYGVEEEPSMNWDLELSSVWVCHGRLCMRTYANWFSVLALVSWNLPRTRDSPHSLWILRKQQKRSPHWHGPVWAIWKWIKTYQDPRPIGNLRRTTHFCLVGFSCLNHVRLGLTYMSFYFSFLNHLEESSTSSFWVLMWESTSKITFQAAHSKISRFQPSHPHSRFQLCQ